MTYKIVRFYFNDGPDTSHVIETGLTLEEAQEHCQDDQTSSTTANSPIAVAHTEAWGPWFDGYTQEDEDEAIPNPDEDDDPVIEARKWA